MKWQASVLTATKKPSGLRGSSTNIHTVYVQDATGNRQASKARRLGKPPTTNEAAVATYVEREDRLGPISKLAHPRSQYRRRCNNWLATRLQVHARRPSDAGVSTGTYR